MKTTNNKNRCAELRKMSRVKSSTNDLSAHISLSVHELRELTGGNGSNSGASIGSILSHITPGMASLWGGLKHALQ